tara:strand:+ start:3157 stop:4533 length:1377 start_codon:yes stop_codon:yes gene_type:complete
MSNSPASQVKRYMRLSPSNGSGSFSFTNGNPIIKFSVADTQAMLVGKEMRFCGQLVLFKTGTTVVASTDVINIDRIAGLQSFISSVSIGSRRYSASVLEVVHNYPRLCASLYAQTHSPKGMRTQIFNEQGASGKGRYNAYDQKAQQSNASGNNDRSLKNARNSVLVNRSATNGFEFALRLNTGLLMNEAIPLNLLGGLEITINLNSNFSSLYGLPANLSADCSYQIVDPYLMCPLLYLNQDQIAESNQQPQGSFSFMSYQSLYSVLDSTDQSVVHRLNSRNLVSVIQNYIPIKYLNNRSYNGQACWEAGGIDNIEFHKDGVRYPLEYNLTVNKTIGAGTNQDENLQKGDLNPAILWNALSTMGSVKDINRSQVIPENLKGIAKEDGVYVTGVNWDKISKVGVNVNGTLTYDIKTKLEDPDNNDAVNPNHSLQTTYAQYSFYLSKQNLIINKGTGIQVM